MGSPKFCPGDIVFAKVRGYPPWPAKIEGIDCINNRMKYHVYFYGTKQFAVCKEEHLHTFMENRNRFGKLNRLKSFKESILEAEYEIELERNPSTSVDTKHELSPISEVESLEDSRLNGILEGNSLSGEVSNKPQKHGLKRHNNPKEVHRKKGVIYAKHIHKKLKKTLGVQSKMLEIDFGIQSSLCLNKADPETCLKYLDEFLVLEINSLMIKKHPEVLGTLIKLQMYVGNVSSWNMSPEEIKAFNGKVELIKIKAKLMYDKIQSMFLVPYGMTFSQFFREEVKEFSNCTQRFSLETLFSLMEDPTENKDEYVNNKHPGSYKFHS